MKDSQRSMIVLIFFVFSSIVFATPNLHTPFNEVKEIRLKKDFVHSINYNTCNDKPFYKCNQEEEFIYKAFGKEERKSKEVEISRCCLQSHQSYRHYADKER